MLTKIFNILLVSDDQNLFHLLKGVLGSVEHKIQQIDQEEKYCLPCFRMFTIWLFWIKASVLLVPKI